MEKILKPSLSVALLIAALLALVFVALKIGNADTGVAPLAWLCWLAVLLGGAGIVGITQQLLQADGFLGLVPALLVLLLAVFATEALVRAYAVPAAFIPPPTKVVAAFFESSQVLSRDAGTTLLEALLGFVLGSVLGIVLALLVSRFVFLERGLMPYAALFSSVPIVALAPVIIKAIGLEWTSKAIVVAITVLFPVLVNTARGLQEINPLTLDLMRSYAATSTQHYAKLRLPNAMPYVFNALKIGSTLALIGAIVGEFFGTSEGRGLGNRILVESGLSNLAVVWSAIIWASVLGLLWYNLMAFLERRITGWHVSFRTGS